MYFACGTKRDKPSGQSPKQRTKRRIAAVLAAVLLLSLLCGCGGQGGAQGGPEAVVERYVNAAKKRDLNTMQDCLPPSLRERYISRMEDEIEEIKNYNSIEVLEAEKVDQNTWNYVSDVLCDASSGEIRIGEIGDIYLVPVILKDSEVGGVFVVQIDGDYFAFIGF